MQKKIIEILNYNNLNSEFCSKHFPELFNRPDKMSYDLKMIFKAWQRQNLITEKYKSGEIINLSHGDPVQSQLSKNFKKTLKKILSTNTLHKYPSSAGNEQTKVVLSHYINNRYLKNKLITGSNIIIGNSTTYLFNLLCQNLLRPFDVVIIPSPTYGIFAYIPERYGASIKFLDLKQEDNWFVNINELKKAILHINNKLNTLAKQKKLCYIPRVSMLFLINPSNPIGNYYSTKNYDDLEAIAETCIKNNIVIVEDLLYDGTIYDNKKIVSVLNTKAFPDNAVILQGISKAYGLASLRAGFAISNEIIINCLRNKLFQNMDSASLLQSKALEGVFGTPLTTLIKIENKNSNIYEYNLNLIIAMINGIDSIDTQSFNKLIIKDINKVTKNKKFTKKLLNGIEGISILKNSLPQSGFFINLNFQNIKGKKIKNIEIRNIYDVLKLSTQYCKFKFLCGTTYGFKENSMIGRITFSNNKYELIKAFYSLDKILNEEKYYETN